MPRQARLDAPGILHHVMVRGLDYRAIFRDDVDRRDFLTRLRGLVEATTLTVLVMGVRSIDSCFCRSLYLRFSD